jgi:hypothetical protein
MSIYEIHVRGRLDAQWSDWLDGLTVTHDTPSSTLLLGELPDEAALHGVLSKINSLNLHLLSLRRIDPEQVDHEP